MNRYVELNPVTSVANGHAIRVNDGNLCPRMLQVQLRLRSLQAGDLIARQGDVDSVFLLVLDGWIALTKSMSDGETQIVDLLMKGDLAQLGAPGAMTLPYSAEALNDVQYTTLTEDMINGPGSEAAHWRNALMTTTALRQSRSSELLLRLGHGSAETRVCYAVLELFLRLEAIGETLENAFQIPMTQKQFGQFTGLSNVHVCRILRRLGRQGVIRSQGTRMEILDIDTVCRIADVDLQDLRAGIVA